MKRSADGEARRDEKVKRFKESFSSFKVTPINRFNEKNPYYRQPFQFGYFSLDGSRTFHSDDRQLRYYIGSQTQNLKLNLREGYKSCIQKDDDVKERLTHLLTWISKNRSKFQLKEEGTLKHKKK